MVVCPGPYQRCLGLRFLFPVYCIPEVEVTAGKFTSTSTIEKGQFKLLYLSLSLSLTLRSSLICGVITFVVVFLLHFYHIFFFFGVDCPDYSSNHSLFSREHIFVDFNKFPSLLCWCTVIHHHQTQGATLFRRVRSDFTCVQCSVCICTGPPVLSPIRED